MHIEHIVVGTDFSPEAELAAKHALHVARLTGADMTLVHACPSVTPPSSTYTDAWTELRQRQEEEHRQKLEALQAEMRAGGGAVAYVLVADSPAAAVLEVAARNRADLVVVGTRGLTGVEHLLLGSVAEKVLRHSRSHVLVARGPEPETARAAAGQGYRRILVPTDFSESAERALALATALVAEGGSIEVWHWWSSPYGGPMPDPAALRREFEDSARAAAEPLLERYRNPRYRLSFQVEEAPPTHGIQHQLTTAGGYDLVAMGSHRRRGLTRWLLGSVAEATARHAPCSVLIARVPDAD